MLIVGGVKIVEFPVSAPRPHIGMETETVLHSEAL